MLAPLHQVFGAAGERQRRAALGLLREVGRSTGLAYAAAAGAAALVCAGPITTTKETYARG
jgi:hypothetical protein